MSEGLLPKTELAYKRIIRLKWQICEDGQVETTEAEAIPAQTLREILRDAVDRHMPEQDFAALRAVQESERGGLRAVLGRGAHRQDSENLLE